MCDNVPEEPETLLEDEDDCLLYRHVLTSQVKKPGVRFTKVFRSELGHKYILVECSVIALCLPVVSKLSRYKLVCYK